MKAIGRLVAAVAAMTLTVHAAEFYVAPGGKDLTDWGTNWAQPFATISNAVAQATGTGPHVVYVSNGTYAISSEILLTNAITVRSWSNGALAEAGTIVDGDYKTRGFRLTHADAVLAGFTVQHGTNATTGGGVYVSGGGTVTQCVLSANSALEGGGVYIINRGLVTHSTLRGNVAVSNSVYASRGGGVCVLHTGAVDHCVVADNRVVSKTGYSGGGGGIVLYVKATNNEMRVYGTQVSNNVSEKYGGGIFAQQDVGGVTQAVISGSTVASNYSASIGGGIYMSGSANVGLKGTITGCVVKGNYAIGGTDGAAAGIGAQTLARNCTISGNSAPIKGAGCWNVTIYDSVVESNRSVGAGAGLYYLYGGHVISNCVIRGNTADGSAGWGAVYMYYTGPETVIKDCEIRENVAGCTAGITTANINSTGLVYNCLVCDNVCTQEIDSSRGVLCGPFALSGCTIVSNVAGRAAFGSVYLRVGSSVTNCIIYSNKVAGSFGNELKYESGVTSNVVFYSCVPNGIPEDQGNITGPPKFQAFDAGDYRLAADSPCVNAGTNEAWMDGARDLDGRPRKDRFARQVDMGAYEFLPAGALFQLR